MTPLITSMTFSVADSHRIWLRPKVQLFPVGKLGIAPE